MDSKIDMNKNDTIAIFHRHLVGLYIISFLSGFSMGIFNPLISILMEQKGIGQIWIGANSTVYYLMIAVFAPLAGLLIKRFGINTVIVAGLVTTAISTSFFPGTDNLPLWFIIRALMGLGVCFYMVGGQTGLNVYANEEKRGVIVATHGASFGIGFMISPMLGTLLYSHFPRGAFFFGAGIIISGILAVVFLLPNRKIASHQSLSMKVFSKISIPLHGAFIYGALEGIIVTLLPVYLLRQNFPVSMAGIPITLFMIASGIGMIPVSYFGDRFGRSRVLFISAAIGLSTLLAMILINHSYTIVASSVILGLTLGTFFPVTLAMIGERLDASEMHSGSGFFTAFFSYGCAAGPFCSSIAMERFGDSYIFSLLIVLLLTLIIRIMLKNIKPANYTVNEGIKVISYVNKNEQSY